MPYAELATLSSSAWHSICVEHAVCALFGLCAVACFVSAHTCPAQPVLHTVCAFDAGWLLEVAGFVMNCCILVSFRSAEIMNAIHWLLTLAVVSTTLQLLQGASAVRFRAGLFILYFSVVIAARIVSLHTFVMVFSYSSSVATVAGLLPHTVACASAFGTVTITAIPSMIGPSSRTVCHSLPGQSFVSPKQRCWWFSDGSHYQDIELVLIQRLTQLKFP